MELGKVLESFDNKFKELEDYINKEGGIVNAFESSVTALTNKIAAFDARLQELESQLNTLNTALKDLKEIKK